MIISLDLHTISIQFEIECYNVILIVNKFTFVTRNREMKTAHKASRHLEIMLDRIMFVGAYT